MWCSTCHQDTPGVPHATTGRIVCSRCQQPLRSQKSQAPAQICDEGIALDEQPAPAATTAAPFRKDDWPAQQRVRSLARELKRPNIAAKISPTPKSASHLRFEPPQDFFGQLTPAQVASTTPAAARDAEEALLKARRSEGGQIIAWLIVIAGALILGSGIGLITWSLVMKVMTYWNLGFVLALGGQGTLIIGLALVVSRLWRHSRYAASKLQDVHTRLGQLQQTAEILTTMRTSGGAPAFYAELARGASPNMLLTNLKGQLDQLATRISRV
jgi:hypothetical protein